jgi:Flp pilus assembly protein TadD
VTIAATEEAISAADQEFQHFLEQGEERLSAGDAEGARESLRKAADRLPLDISALGLFGQACYRAGLYEEAAEAYGKLVDENPAEVSGRVNLGLAWLKGGRRPEAVRQFSIALDLDPEHRKSMGYLGLALLESGDPRAARPWLEKSGSAALLARCDALLADQVAPPPAAVAPAVVRPSPTPTPEPRPSPNPPPLRTPVAPGGLGAFAAGCTVRPPPEVFAVDGGILHVAVRGEMVCRIDGLVAVRGAVTAHPEVKRFRGKVTEKPFGAGRDRMNRMAGEGALFFRTGGWVFTVVDLAGDAGYFREGAVFALEEAVIFENGRVPSRHSSDLDLVHLRGRGRMLLRTAGAPVAIEVSGTESLRVPPSALVGWTGAVTPRIGLLGGVDGVAATAPSAGSPVMVELTGDGRVFVDPDAAQAD